MPIDPQGYWYPELSPKQLEVYNNYARYTLVSGPKKSGKTIVNMHRLIRHAVETKSARIGMFAKTVKNAKAGGIWNDMVEIAIPEWVDAKQTRITTRKSDGTLGVKQDAQTRMMYFRIKNHSGTESEFQLHSIDNENEVEQIAKGTRFSCFYFAELSNFRNRLVFDITSDQLRMPGLAFKDHLWLGDTNPADDGEDSWIYKLWYKMLMKDNKTQHEDVLAKNMRLIEIMIEENPYLDQETRDDLYARFAHDPDLHARYILGKWVRATRDAIFIHQFNSDVHVVGDCSNLDKDEWQNLLPSETCYQMVSGWDLGDRFHSAHIIEPVVTQLGKTYCVIDEIVQIDPEVKMGLSEFAEWFMERMNFWTNFACGDDVERMQMFQWRHWSDKAALQNWRAGAETYDKNLVFKYTDGEVELMGAPKFPGSVLKRINLCKILLFEKRLIIGARCFKTIEMFKALRAGSGAKLIADAQPLRHVFDSISYALSAEEPALLAQEIADIENKAEGGPIVVPL